MEIIEYDVADDSIVGQHFDLAVASFTADRPEAHPPCRVRHLGALRHPDPDATVLRRAAFVGGQLVGVLTVELPMRDNLHWASGGVMVHPEYRRRGIGRALMETGLDLARDAGRRSFGSDAVIAVEGGPKREGAGAAFLEALGFERALTEVIRRMDLDAVDPAVEQELYDRAVEKASDYEIIGWTESAPEELLGPLARLDNTFLAQAPIGDLDLEPLTRDADALRRLLEVGRSHGLFLTGVVARVPGSEELVANTAIEVSTEPGDHADQGITLVAQEHRGHGLGLRLKLENHRQLRAVRPEVRWVWTGNADVNAHMIAINELLGFVPVDASAEYQRTL